MVTAKDRMALIDEANKKKITAIEESEKRKEILRKSFVAQQAPGSKLDKVDNRKVLNILLM